MKDKSSRLTYAIVTFVMITWGLNVVMLKVLVSEFPPLWMTTFRIFAAGIATLSIILIGRKIRLLTKKEWRYSLIGAFLGVTCHHYFLAKGLTLTDASNTVLILALLPLTTSVFAMLFLGDRLTKWRIVGIGLAFIGVIFIQGGGKGALSSGELYVFMAMLVQALSFIYIKKGTTTLDSKQMTSMMLLIGSVGLLLVSFVMEPQSIGRLFEASLPIYIIFFVSAIIATGIGHILFNAAIQRIGAGQTAIFNNLVPFFGLVSSAIFLKEQVYWYQSFGFVFIVVGVLFGTGTIEKAIRKREIIHETIHEKSM
jgi:drug/metabolite transporter (DMT)-like permease